ncbi:MAG TPA: T9SS type A sorting domain-containing protein [Paludibacteraceae bacterium]|nr:T9SS type A sorting domain-containing protein [Paludibacteraceae bacterium]
MKKTLLFISLFCMSLYASAQAPVKITFESDAVGSAGGATAVWSAGSVDVVANTYTTGNPSAKALHVLNTGYLGVYFGNIPLPAGAETMYSKIKVKYLIVGGTDKDYPLLEIFSAPNNYTMGDPEKFGEVPWAGLWGTAEIGVWKTVEFAFANVTKAVPAGNLILKLSKSNTEYLIDDVELVPSVAPAPVITLADFEANTIGEVLTMRRWTPTDASATVEANPTVASEKSVHILATNWNSALKLNIALPTGKTIADYETLSFDIYLNNIDGTDNVWKNIEVYVDDVKKIDKQSPGVANAWEAKSYSLEGITSANSLVMDIGLNTNKGNYYLDNIKITEKASTGISPSAVNPLFVYSASNTFVLNQQVDTYELYNVQGSRISAGRNASSINTTNLGNGIYILKASIGNDKFVTKLLK